MRTQDSHSESEFEHDPLWDVLGRAAPVDASQISPLFARNVVRTIRLSEQKVERFPTRWRIPALAAAALIVTGIFCTALTPSGTLNSGTLNSGTLNSGTLNPAGLNARDAEVIRHLDELLTYDETNLWLEPPVL